MSDARTKGATRATSTDSPTVTMLRSDLGRVKGLGSAKSGTAHWWAERWTSAALVPLTLWFVWNAIALAGLPRDAVAAWLASPVSLVLMLTLVLTTFHHMHLGLQVVIEDYVHSEGTRFAVLLAMRGMTFLFGLAAGVAVLKLGL